MVQFATVFFQLLLLVWSGKHGPLNHRCSGSNKPPQQFLQSSLHAQQDPQQASVPAAVTNPVPATSQPQPTHSSNPTSQPQLDTHLSSPTFRPARVNILKWIPRGSRRLAAEKLTAILTDVVTKNDGDSWLCLLYFSSRCFRVPQMTALVNQQLREEMDPASTSKHRGRSGRKERCWGSFGLFGITCILEIGGRGF